MEKRDTVAVTYHLPAELHKQLKLVSAMRGKKMKDAVVEALRRYVAGVSFK